MDRPLSLAPQAPLAPSSRLRQTFYHPLRSLSSILQDATPIGQLAELLHSMWPTDLTHRTHNRANDDAAFHSYPSGAFECYPQPITWSPSAFPLYALLPS